MVARETAKVSDTWHRVLTDADLSSEDSGGHEPGLPQEDSVCGVHKRFPAGISGGGREEG